MYLQNIREQNPDIETLILSVTKNFPNFDAEGLELIQKAYTFSESAHSGQKRASGESFFTHPFNVAYILAEMGMCPATVAAGLLHDVLEDTSVTKEAFQKEFGSEITQLVEGVTKLNLISEMSKRQDEIQALQKMLFAVVQDFRVIVVKLADKIHNLRTIKHLSPKSQKTIASFALDVYVPLAHKLGIHSMKNEIEKLAFPVAYPELNSIIEKQMQPHREAKRAELEEMKKNLENALPDCCGNIEFEIYERSNYHIRKRITRQPIDSIHDYSILVCSTENVENCYKTLGIVHSLYFPIPNQLRDNINNPSTLYRAINTTVVGNKGTQCEIAVRTKKMNELVKKGVIAYVYDPEKMYDLVRKRIYNLKYILDNVQGEEGFLETLQSDLFQHTLVVFTRDGDSVELPMGSTPVDFAYYLNPELGNKCMGVKVNGRSVPLWYQLNNGDKIEIIASENETVNSQWLDFVKLHRSKKEIEKKLGIMSQESLSKENLQNVTIQISSKDRVGLLADYATIISAENANIIHVLSDFPTTSTITSAMVIQIDDPKKIERIASKISKVPGVLDVKTSYW